MGKKQLRPIKYLGYDDYDDFEEMFESNGCIEFDYINEKGKKLHIC